MAFLEFQYSDEKIKIHHFSTEKSSRIRKVLFELLMEELTLVKLAVEEKCDFQKLDVNIDKFLAFSAGHEGEAKKYRCTKGAVLARFMSFSKKTKASCHHFLYEISVYHGFDIRIGF